MSEKSNLCLTGTIRLVLLAVEKFSLIVELVGGAADVSTCSISRRGSQCRYLLIFQVSDQCGRGPLSKLVRQHLSLPALQITSHTKFEGVGTCQHLW